MPPRQSDGLQWLIELCQSKQDPKQLEAARLIHRLLLLNVVSIHSTSFTTANTILDLYSSISTSEFVGGLRDECERMLAGAQGTWSKEALNELSRVDSTIRESMRLSTFGIVGLSRRASPTSV